MDHLVAIANWHGEPPARAQRKRCALAARANGDAAHGVRYRTSAWLERLEKTRHVAASAATVRVLRPHMPPPPSSPSPPPLLRRLPKELWSGSAPKITKHGAYLRQGREIWLPVASSDESLRSSYAAQAFARNRIVDGAGEPTLLHVTLQDAQALLACSSEVGQLERLFRTLFTSRWCYRPEEMTEVRFDPFRDDNSTIDVCVWGFSVPKPPPFCPARQN
eukprot:scaffold267659_cov35-Tisochrysis_lutea.AAC.5